MKKVTPKQEQYLETGPVGPAKSKKEPPKIYPRLRMEHQFFPEAKKHEVGKTYEVKLKIKAVGLSISRFSNDTEYEIHGYELGKSVDNEEE